MGKLQEFDITFTNNKVVYGPGESMSGTVKIRTGNPLQYKGTSSSSLFSRFSLTAFCAQRSAQLDGNKLFVSVDAKKSRSPGTILGILGLSDSFCGGERLGIHLGFSVVVRHVCSLQLKGRLLLLRYPRAHPAFHSLLLPCIV